MSKRSGYPASPQLCRKSTQPTSPSGHHASTTTASTFSLPCVVFAPRSFFQIETAWRRRWSTVEIPNKALISDPTRALPDAKLRRCQWVLLNRLRCRTGPCRDILHRWGLQDSPLCNCGEVQTMEHISDACRPTKFPGGVVALHPGDAAASAWLQARLQ